MIEIFQYEFMRHALCAALLVGIACGVVGTFVVTKKIVFISGGISHAAFGGIGLGYLLGVNPIIMALPFSILSAIGIGILRRRTRISEDSAIGILWTIGMALGILFISLTPGYAPDLFGYLFGSILSVPMIDILIMGVLDIIIIATTIVLFKELQAISFDEEFSLIVGVPTDLLYFILLGLIALSTIVLIRVVGIILIIALLTFPATIVKQFSSTLKKIALFTTILAIALSVGGLILSFLLDLPSGATIVLLCGVCFIVSVVIKRVISRR
ncbi:metal ABC transporter permease [candidate division WOR-3 bacterium]|nr:metal ABC transporter permease [candidate division WOR-3 bacterium]